MRTRFKFHCHRTLGAVAIIGFAPLVVAQTDLHPLHPAYVDEMESGSWSFDTIVGIEQEPTYAGSKNYETELDGNVRATYKDARGSRYELSIGEIRSTFDLNDCWTFQLKLEYEESRDAEEEPILAPLKPVDSTLEAELIFAYRRGKNYYFFDFQPDILGKGKGLVYFLGADKSLIWPDTPWRADLRFDVSFGDDEHMMTEFGISPMDSLASGYDPYNPGGGLKSTTASILGQRTINDRWSAIAGLEVEHYFSKASDSPLIRDFGSRSTYELSLDAMFRF